MPLSPEFSRKTFAAILAGVIAACPAFADKPPWAGGGNKHEREERSEPHGNKKHVDDHDGGKPRKHARFESRDKVIVRHYFEDDHRRGHCPPGLAKKHNGCMPPGQAKKHWKVGSKLSRSVVYYELPPALVVKIGAPPPGHQYVRVSTDILLVAVGTLIVVDAIRDLGRQ